MAGERRGAKSDGVEGEVAELPLLASVASWETNNQPDVGDDDDELSNRSSTGEDEEDEGSGTEDEDNGDVAVTVVGSAPCPSTLSCSGDAEEEEASARNEMSGFVAASSAALATVAEGIEGVVQEKNEEDKEVEKCAAGVVEDASGSVVVSDISPTTWAAVMMFCNPGERKEKECYRFYHFHHSN